MDEKLAADNALISDLGGVAELARRLGYSIQRVQNWKSRGIPPEEKLNRPDLFLRELTAKAAPRKTAKAA
jgi:phage terminase Nu1 subunit (DNA packaging protein)